MRAHAIATPFSTWVVVVADLGGPPVGGSREEPPGRPTVSLLHRGNGDIVRAPRASGRWPETVVPFSPGPPTGGGRKPQYLSSTAADRWD